MTLTAPHPHSPFPVSVIASFCPLYSQVFPVPSPLLGSKAVDNQKLFAFILYHFPVLLPLPPDNLLPKFSIFLDNKILGGSLSLTLSSYSLMGEGLGSGCSLSCNVPSPESLQFSYLLASGFCLKCYLNEMAINCCLSKHPGPPDPYYYFKFYITFYII